MYGLGIKHVVGRHTAIALKDSIQNHIDEFKLNGRVMAIVTDNAKNMINSLSLLNSASNQQIESIRCVGHIIHLVINRLFKHLKSYGKSTLDDLAYDSNEDGINEQTDYNNNFSKSVFVGVISVILNMQSHCLLFQAFYSVRIFIRTGTD